MSGIREEFERQEGSRDRKVLLLGGAGYIGSVVAGHLLELGYSVRCLDLLLYENQQAVLAWLGRPNYEFLYGDMADRALLDRALVGATDVIILAGLVGDPITKKYPDESTKINVHGMRKTIAALDGRRLNKVIFVSTCSNYGLIPDDGLADERHVLNPLSLYAKAKVQIEQELLHLEGRVDYFPTVLRFATAFGLSPRTRFDLTVNEFVREMYLKRELVVFDADTWRPYCHVGDFAVALRSALEAPADRVAFQVFNAGGEINNMTKRMVVDCIRDALPESPVRYLDKGSDPRNYRVDFKKIKRVLSFEPRHSVADGVRELVGAFAQRLFVGVDAQPNFYGNYEIKAW
jgi:nucleoside-diphosphate-sugar epimerase